MTVGMWIYGSGGFARELAWLAECCASADTTPPVLGFIDDDESRHGMVINDLPVLGLEEAKAHSPGAGFAVGIGSPQTRDRVFGKARTAGFQPITLIHPRTEMSSRIEVGEGTVICAGNILTTNIGLGAGVQINLDCTIGHDVIMGDFTTLAPGVHVSGWVHMGKRVYFGTGAVVINGTDSNPLVIGDDAVIGAGACVTRSVEAGSLVVGVPAKPRG